MASSTQTRVHPRANEEKEDSFTYAIELVLTTVLPMTMKSAIQLGIFDIISKAGPGAKLSASEIAAQMPTRNKDAPMMLDRILRLLATHSVLECSMDGSLKLYSLAPVSKYFVRDQDGASVGPFMVLMQDPASLASWSQLTEAILEGGVPFDRVHGTHAFEYTSVDSRFNQVFNTAMDTHTALVIKNFLEVYKGFDDIKQLVDVGGGLGVTLNSIICKYPHIKGINFDLPQVIQHGPDYPGVEHVGGDMFQSVPKCDAIFMKWILHNWSDERCFKLLKNCCNSLPENGKVIVMESILSEFPETTSTSKANSKLDVLMMTQCPGGKERTQSEFMALATGAGFSGIRFECFVCNHWVMEFFK